MKLIKNLLYIILFTVFITMLFISSINRMVVFVKHFSVFLLLALVSYDLVSRVAEKLIDTYQLTGIKETIVYIGRVTTFLVLILTISTFQINYVKFQEIPYTEGCKYYDRYNNLIYQTQYAFSCPDLHLVTNDSKTLSFDVTEISSRSDFDIFEIDKNNYMENNPVLTTEMLTTIEITYDDNYRINSINYQLSSITHVTAEGYEDFYSYHSFHQKIENEYGDSSFDQIVLTASRTFETFPKSLINNVTHSSFDDTDYLKTHYFTVKDKQTDRNTYDLMKEYTEDGVVKTENILKIEYSNPSDESSHYSLTVNEKGDWLNQKLINILKQDNSVIYSINEELDTGSNHNQAIYFKNYSGYEQLISFNKDDSNAKESPIQVKKDYSFISGIDGNKYLISNVKMDKNHKNLSNTFEDRYIYMIESTDYGKKVVYKLFRDQNYFISLLEGKFEIEKYQIQFGSSYKTDKLFDLEYHVENTTQQNQIFYHDLPFLINYN